ncbi:COR domain-containing protein [Rhodobacter capsulatus]|uniref:COR domain-containing protein n=1 Tax=Rhodobacter capsulatus TaxID=1061 RepID=UPI004027F690
MVRATSRPRRISSCPASRITSGLTRLELNGSQIGDAGAQAIAQGLTGLTRLELNGSQIGDAGAQAIAQSLTGLTRLELNGSQIGDAGAQAIAQGLTGLTRLFLDHNQIGDAGAQAIAQSLSGLTQLSLDHNQIGDAGAQAIAQGLSGLTLLSLDQNQIGNAGAQAIAQGLSGLTRLCLDQNQIGDAGAQAIAQGLSGLTQLSLRQNQIGDAGAQAIAQGLQKLETLNLDDNLIGDIGAQAIAQGLQTLSVLLLGRNQIGAVGAETLLNSLQDRTLDFLLLHGNPCQNQLMTPESFNTPVARELLSAWRDWLAAGREGNATPLNMAKLLILGEEAVGKTSLVRFLVEGEPRNPDEKKTRGVRQSERIETTAWHPEGCSIRVNVWDFAGQEITHGTHRYFLTERSLYLIVLEDRREDDPPIEKWLRMIGSVAGDAPVIVVINKSDNGKKCLLLDEEALQRCHPQIVGFVRTACNDDAWSRDSIKVLRERIAETLLKDSRFDTLRSPVPRHWLAVKDAVEAKSRASAVLTVADFDAICADPAVVGERVLDADLRRALLRMLHEMGVVVAHGLSREAPAALREVTLLDPNWLTEAIYAVLNDTQLQHRGGRFTRADLAKCLPEDRYPPERLEFILSMMQNRDLELCFRIDGEEEVYLAPAALPPNSPDFTGWDDEALRFRLRYSELPLSVMVRFIVRMAPRLERPENAWRSGVRLRIGAAEVLVRSFRDDRRIEIAIRGEGRRDALAVVRDTFAEIHRGFEDLGVRELVPMPDKPEVEEDYLHLLRLERSKGADCMHCPTGAERDYRVGDLLERVDRRPAGPTSTAAEPTVMRPAVSPAVPTSSNVTYVAPTVFSAGLAVLLGLGWQMPWRIWGLIVGFVWVCFWLFLRSQDRGFLFRRTLILWGLSGIGLVTLRGLSLSLDLPLLKLGFGNIDWIALIGWLAVGVIIGIMAWDERRPPPSPGAH